MYQHELEAIGKRIEELRKGKGWTQEMLAEKLNIARNTLTKLEGGFRDFKSTELLNIAKVLKVSTDYLLGLTTVSRSDVTIREVSERYGLSEVTLTRLDFLQKAVTNPGDKPFVTELCKQELQTINDLIEDVTALSCISAYIYFDISSGERLHCEIEREDGRKEPWVISGDSLLDGRYDSIREFLDVIRNKRRSRT